MAHFKPRGSNFSFSDQGVFYSLLDSHPTALAVPDNKANIIAALTTIAAAGGGVLLVPHGVAHTFNPATDFPVSANALCVWEFKGNSFKLMGNLAITSSLGNIVETSLYEETRTASHKVVDAVDPVTYTYEEKVADAGIAGSDNDLCQYIPGGTLVEAIARAGADLGKRFFLKGIDVVGGASADLFSGVKKFNLEVTTPAAVTNVSIALADTTELLHMDHAGTVAAFTITLPAAPKDGQMVRMWARSAITTLTLNAGAGESIATGSAITTLAAGASASFVHKLSNNTWYRVS